jgi:hypothetical protein
LGGTLAIRDAQVYVKRFCTMSLTADNACGETVSVIPNPYACA